MAFVEVSVIPIGTKTASLSSFVARALGVLHAQPDLKYELTPMGTVIEGDVERILEVVSRMHHSLFDNDVVRVVTTIKIDERRDKAVGMRERVESVKMKLAK